MTKLTIEENLEKIANQTDNPEIAWTARNYLREFNEGYVGSNSSDLLIFLQDPIKYHKQNGAVVYPSAL